MMRKGRGILPGKVPFNLRIPLEDGLKPLSVPIPIASAPLCVSVVKEEVPRIPAKRSSTCTPGKVVLLFSWWERMEGKGD
jgi:hypothetical protein